MIVSSTHSCLSQAKSTLCPPTTSDSRRNDSKVCSPPRRTAQVNFIQAFYICAAASASPEGIRDSLRLLDDLASTENIDHTHCRSLERAMLSETPNESKQIRKDVVYAERTEPYRSAATVDHTPNCEVLRHFAIDGLLL